MTDTAAARAALVTIMELVAGPDLHCPIDPDGDDSIRRLGLTSVRLLEFMVAVEDTLGVLWGDDADPTVLASFQAMADYLSARGIPARRLETLSASTVAGGRP